MQDNSRLDMTAFLQDLPEDEMTVTRILGNEENLNAIAVTAKLIETGRLRSWLDRLDALYNESASVPETKVSTKARLSSEPTSTVATTALVKLDIQKVHIDDYDDLIPLPPPGHRFEDPIPLLPPDSSPDSTVSWYGAPSMSTHSVNQSDNVPPNTTAPTHH
ncbi:hypothetical protein K458DRAFT_410278 [Lentithecium fluviatile CBS 122367]|uniref:Uncharacterized protein n=1 Tax=Lentithecium fluviatile CBS 122367 TaxID=1168545 RepID=A0A6G1IF71_9PLEO|nr:hypothetical protein K458DRAFT_410278 [Lentithecium fluviatile CBS 122367]